MEEQILYEEHPAMFKKHPFWFLLSVVLIAAAGLGVIILLVWWLRTLGTTLIVSDQRVTLRHGIVSRHTNEVFHTDIRNVKISQGVLQRMLGVGTLGIASAGRGEMEIRVDGLPDPIRVKEIIDRYRREG